MFIHMNNYFLSTEDLVSVDAIFTDVVSVDAIFLHPRTVYEPRLELTMATPRS